MTIWAILAAAALMQVGATAQAPAVRQQQNVKSQLQQNARPQQFVPPQQGVPPQAAPQTPAAPAATVGPRGFYVLQATDKVTVPDESLALDAVAGLAIRASWKTIEPEPGKFDWQYLDEQFARAKRFNKKTQLIVYCGAWSPDWVYNAGVKSLSFSDLRKSPTPLRMPLPWDPQLHIFAGKLFDAVGQRYAADPSLTAVHLSIVMRFSAEMHMPNELAGAPGYSPEQMVAAWRQAIAIQNRAFPKTCLVLNISQQAYTDAVIGEMRKLGARAVFQHDALAAKTVASFAPHQKVAALRAAGYRVGFEALGPSNQPRFGGPFSVACDKALQAGASYFNVYPYEPAHHADVMRQYAGRFRP